MSFGELVTKEEVFLESSHRIETHLDFVVEVLEIQSSVSFDLYLGEELLEFVWGYLMFEGRHATNFSRVPPIQWSIPPVRRDHSGRFWRSQYILLVW